MCIVVDEILHADAVAVHQLAELARLPLVVLGVDARKSLGDLLVVERVHIVEKRVFEYVLMRIQVKVERVQVDGEKTRTPQHLM